MLQDLHAAEQRVEVLLDDLVQEYEPGLLDLEQARQDLRHLDPREAAFARGRIAQADGDRQAQRGDVREGMPGIHGEWRQDRIDLVQEALAQRLVMLGDGRVVDEFDALRRKGTADVQVDPGVLAGQFEDARADDLELFLGRPAVGRTCRLARLDLLAQPRDADLEELVEVVGEDAQELDAFEERVALVAGFEQDAGVEVQPGQFPVEVREVDFDSGGSPGSRRHPGTCGPGGSGWTGSKGGHVGEEAPG